VPFLEYKRVNEELKESLKRISELESQLAELRKENEMLKQEVGKGKKRKWFF